MFTYTYSFAYMKFIFQQLAHYVWVFHRYVYVRHWLVQELRAHNK